MVISGIINRRIIMPRQSRLKSDIAIYHVMQRGINKQTIFYDDEDCFTYLQFLQECKEKSGFELYSYCLMGNHTHLLIKEVKEPLSLIFKRFGTKYAYWYNQKYQRCGHLFQDRFRSEPIKDDRQFIAVLRYIYQNPIKAGICERPEDYKWSSYRYLDNNYQLIDKKGITEIIPIDELKSLTRVNTEEQFLDLKSIRMSDREADLWIKDRFTNGISSENLKLESGFQEACYKMLYELYEKGCSIRQLARLTGISREKIGRILKSNLKSKPAKRTVPLVAPVRSD